MSADLSSESEWWEMSSFTNDASECLEVFVGFVNRLEVGPDGAVGGLEVEHRFASLLCHGHEALIVLNQSQFVRVVLDAHTVIGRLGKHILAVVAGYPIDPFVVRTVEPDAMLKDDVAQRFRSEE